jgi:hypothetical protein
LLVATYKRHQISPKNRLRKRGNSAHSIQRQVRLCPWIPVQVCSAMGMMIRPWGGHSTPSCQPGRSGETALTDGSALTQSSGGYLHAPVKACQSSVRARTGSVWRVFPLRTLPLSIWMGIVIVHLICAIALILLLLTERVVSWLPDYLRRQQPNAVQQGFGISKVASLVCGALAATTRGSSGVAPLSTAVSAWQCLARPARQQFPTLQHQAVLLGHR